MCFLINFFLLFKRIIIILFLLFLFIILLNFNYIYIPYSEIIGYVDGIESPRLVGNKQQFNFFKFYLNNNKGRKIQVVAWNDDVKRVEDIILSSHVNVLFFINIFNI